MKKQVPEQDTNLNAVVNAPGLSLIFCLPYSFGGSLYVFPDNFQEKRASGDGQGQLLSPSELDPRWAVNRLTREFVTVF